MLVVAISKALHPEMLSLFLFAVLICIKLCDARVTPLRLKVAMTCCRQLDAAIAQPTKNLEPVNVTLTKALTKSIKDLHRKDRINAFVFRTFFKNGALLGHFLRFFLTHGTPQQVSASQRVTG